MPDYYETHKLGLLRFYLFTNTLTSVIDPEEGVKMQTDEQLENAAESGQDKNTMEKVEQLPSKRHKTLLVIKWLDNFYGKKYSEKQK